jgi:hypothetical protein
MTLSFQAWELGSRTTLRSHLFSWGVFQGDFDRPRPSNREILGEFGPDYMPKGSR